MSVLLQCMPEPVMAATTTSPPAETTISRPTTPPVQHLATTTAAPREGTTFLPPINVSTISNLSTPFIIDNIDIFREGIEHEAFVFASIIPLSLAPEEVPVDDQDHNMRGIPFSISLSNLGGGQILVQVESVEVNVTLECPDGQAPVGFECRDTLCPNGYISTGGRCFFQFGNSHLLTNNTNMTVQIGDESGSGFFLDCPTELVLVNDTDFTQLTNISILVDGVEFEVLEYSDKGKPLICPRNPTMTEFFKRFLFSYPPAYLELTYAGCSLSAIGCILMLIIYGLFKDLRSLPTKILMNLAFAILAVNLLFLIGGPVSIHFPLIEICTTIAICLHFFFLAQFVWMSVMTFEMVRKFYQSKQMALDTKKSRQKLFIIYTLFGWSLPLVIITSTITVNFTTSSIILYGVQVDGSLGSCWINHQLSAVIAFVAPLVFAVVFNLIMFTIVTVYIIMAAQNQNKLKRIPVTKFLFFG